MDVAMIFLQMGNYYFHSETFLVSVTTKLKYSDTAPMDNSKDPVKTPSSAPFFPLLIFFHILFGLHASTHPN